jgi:branched-chain amino acid transport system ATP-binding protein
MLNIRNLAVSYGHIDALKGVDITVDEGSVVAVIGSNGAGKTTLLNAISGLVKPKAGTLEFRGKPLPVEAHKIVRAGIVQVPEGRKIFAGLSVRENLLMGGFLDNDRKRYASNLERMYTRFPRLKERQHQQAGTLSGGEQQMLAVCRGLMANPSLILLDEPSLGLAPVLVSEVFSLISEIRAMGMTILLVEQNANKALSIADKAYVLETGTIVHAGTGRQLLQDDAVRSAYLGAREWCEDDEA